MFAVDNINAPVKTYTPRKHFYTVAQISKWVRPGAQRINVSGTTSPFTPLLAFKHPGLGQVTIVGINTSGSAATLSGTLASLPAVPHLDLYYTSATTNLAVWWQRAGQQRNIQRDDSGRLRVHFDRVHRGQCRPHESGQRRAIHRAGGDPAGLHGHATAGSIALVWFYNGVTPLGEATVAPYGFTWNNVPMGNYGLTAVAGDTLGNIGTSAVVNVTVVGPLAQIGVTPANATVAPGGAQQFSATGA